MGDDHDLLRLHGRVPRPAHPDGSGVIFNGEEVPFIRREDRFGLAGAPDETYETLFVPHHGPVIEIDEDLGVAVTMRWTGQDADTDVNFLLNLARASSVEEGERSDQERDHDRTELRGRR